MFETNNLNATDMPSDKPEPYIKIVEQPTNQAIKFRYVCEKRASGTIRGINFTPKNKTYPSIEIMNWQGEVEIVASLVTKDAPYKAHPHNLVGKEKYFRDGIFKKTLKKEPYRIVFHNLGIQCVKKKEIIAALDKRERLHVDPFKENFSHKFQPARIDLNTVRLCFEAKLILPEGGHQQLAPVVSEPIFGERAINELNISRLSGYTANINGGDEIILLCERVVKGDIKIRFFELNGDDVTTWEDFGNFTSNDIHKQTAIVFKTPRYYKKEMAKDAKIFIQLLRPSDGMTSEALPFEFYSNQHTFSHLINRNLSKIQSKSPKAVIKDKLQRSLPYPRQNYPKQFLDNPRLIENQRNSTSELSVSPTQLESFDTYYIPDETLLQLQHSQPRNINETQNSFHDSVRVSQNNTHNNDNIQKTYTTLYPTQRNVPEAPSRNITYTSGGSITCLEGRHNTQYSTHLNFNGKDLPTTALSELSAIKPLENHQYTVINAEQQSTNFNILEELSQQSTIPNTVINQENYPNSDSGYESSDDFITTSDLIRMIVEDFPFDFSTFT